MLNCEQCKESDKNEGECTECAGVFVLHQGTCNNSKYNLFSAYHVFIVYFVQTVIFLIVLHVMW